MIREMEPGEEHLLQEIDERADRLLEPFGYWPLPDVAGAARDDRAVAAVTFVAGRPPVGFAEVALVDGHAHLAQLSVVPEHGGKGLGRALIDAACEWARACGHTSMTLTTFADIPFNAPWYARLGFVEMPDPGPQLRAIMEAEKPLDARGRRVVMRLALTPGENFPGFA